MKTWKLLLFIQMSFFACFLTDNFHIIIYSTCLNFISNNSLICHIQDGCFLFDIIHSVEREVPYRRQVQFIAFLPL